MNRTLYIAATDQDEARSIAYAVAAGRCGHIEHHLTTDAAQRIADHLNRLAERDGRALRRTVFPVDVGETTTHDGRITVARLADGAGDVAAALTLVTVIPALLARFWGALS